MPAPALLAILDLEVAAARGLEPMRLVDLWLDLGIRDLLVRSTVRAARPLFVHAVMAVERANRTGARVLISDRVDVAIASGAAGVQLASSGLPFDATARLVALAARPMVIARSVHQSQSDLADARYDWVCAAPVFEPSSKVSVSAPLGLDGLKRVVELSPVPVVALGGMRPDLLASVAAAGAVGAAVLGAIATFDRLMIADFVDAAAAAWPGAEAR